MPAPDSSEIDAAVIALLQNDPELRTLMPDGVYFDPAPPGLLQYVIISLALAEDVAEFGRRAWENVRYAITAVQRTTGGGGGTKEAADRIDALLEDTPISVAGYSWITTHREERIRYTEVDETDSTIRWQHRGGRYRVQMAATADGSTPAPPGTGPPGPPGPEGPPGPQGEPGEDATLPTAPRGQLLISQGAGVPSVYSHTPIVEGAQPSITLRDTTAPANSRDWIIRIELADGVSRLVFRPVNDAGVPATAYVYISPFAGSIGAGGNATFEGQIWSLQQLITSRYLESIEQPLAALPPPSRGVGALANISDSDTNVPGAVIAGGGSFHVLARYNGTAWIVIGG